MWEPGLVLFDSDKDVVSGENLVFGNILGFPGPKMDQNRQLWLCPVSA